MPPTPTDGRPSALLTSGEVAARLGVAPATLKRWTDTGRLRCVRTAGGHRRFDEADVERLRLRLTGAPDAITRWVDQLLADRDIATTAALLVERERLGAWWRVADALGPVLGEVGRRWEEGEIAILHEHAATDRMTRALARCSEVLPVDPQAPRLLLAAAEEEEHTLGLSLVELAARERGWRAVWAGRSVPAAEIVRAVSAREVEAVALSASVVRDRGALARQVEVVGSACEQHGVLLVLGGMGPWPEPPPRYATLERRFAGLVRWMEEVERARAGDPSKQRAT